MSERDEHIKQIREVLDDVRRRREQGDPAADALLIVIYERNLAQAQLAAALDALRELHDFSGDPHHYRDSETYQAAKERAAQILKEHEA